MQAKFLHGPYPTPLVVKGTRLVCGVRGVVRIVGLSNAAIPWPIGEQDGQQELVVYRGLARALRTESADAVAAAWGVPVAKVKAWQVPAEKPGKPTPRTPTKKRPWSPDEDIVLLSVDDDKKAAAILARTARAVWLRRHWLKLGQAKAADRMRKPARKKRRQ